MITYENSSPKLLSFFLIGNNYFKEKNLEVLIIPYIYSICGHILDSFLFRSSIVHLLLYSFHFISRIILRQVSQKELRLIDLNLDKKIEI